MPLQQRQLDALKEAQIQLAVEALKRDPKLSVKRAVSIYKVSKTTLRKWRARRPLRADTIANLRNLTNTKEQVIVKHILELVARGFPLRLAAVANIANSLRAERNLGYVSLNWPSTFVKRQPELTVKFNRKYDYKRALCEDPEVI